MEALQNSYILLGLVCILMSYKLWKSIGEYCEDIRCRYHHQTPIIRVMPQPLYQTEITHLGWKGYLVLVVAQQVWTKWHWLTEGQSQADTFGHFKFGLARLYM